MNLIKLLLNPYAWGILAAVAALSFLIGDFNGFNAHWYEQCKVKTARRNAAVASVNADETAKHKAEEAKRKKQAKEFASCPGIQQCPLTKETAACLSIIE